jgi:Fe-S-cluster-containing hydrogenase component 2
VTEQTYPLQSLQAGCWFKLICGASYQHLPVIRNLALAYTLAGVDCIDVAADPVVVRVVQEAMHTAAVLSASRSEKLPTCPWLMISINDGEDPHFRKATFNPDHCPSDCPRPCVTVCPTQAIAFAEPSSTKQSSGVMESRCYGCGRCLTVCPFQLIAAETHVTPTATVLPQIIGAVDAIEIHTQIGRQSQFEQLLQMIRPSLGRLKMLSISCPDGDGVIDYLWELYHCLGALPLPLVWQTDGRPMSGDIGPGTTRTTLRYGQRVLQEGPPGYVQLAGGTNHQTVPNLLTVPGGYRANRPLVGLDEPMVDKLRRPIFGGVAYGSYARKLLQPIFNTLDMDGQPMSSTQSNTMLLEDVPDLLERAIQQCQTLLGPLKGWHPKEADPPSPSVIV